MKRAVLLGLLSVVAITLGAHPALSQPVDDLEALKKDFETLKEGQAAIQKDLQEIRGLLRARPTAAAPAPAPVPQEVVLSLDGAPVKGDKNAKVTLVDFTDYQ